MTDTVRIDPAQKRLLSIELVRKETLRGLLILLLVSTVFLFLRMVLRLFGASPQSLFASFIYFVSDIFMLPFFGIFPTFRDVIPGQATVDVAAFTAFFCYIILILLFMSVVQIASTMMKSQKQVKETIEKNNPVDASNLENRIE